MKELVLRSGKYLLFFLLIVVSLPGCDEIESEIPRVPVNFQVNMNIYNELQNPGSSVLFEKAGFGGVIVSCHIQGEYYAFDAACTHEIHQSCHVEPNGLIGECSCCGSQFPLFYSASPTVGPAAAPLKQYHVALLNSFTLQVYN